MLVYQRDLDRAERAGINRRSAIHGENASLTELRLNELLLHAMRRSVMRKKALAGGSGGGR
jgi:hypothetical protein